MSEEILKRLEGRLDRRSFLRGSGLAAAALAGAAALPRGVFAQEPAPQENKPAEKPAEGEKKEDKPAEGAKDGTKKEETRKDETAKKEEEDPFKVTKIDENGKPYRLCPQCGYNMYQQDKVWSCENCGYSYVE